MNIAIVSHACVVPENRARWQRLAERHPDTEVTVLVPSHWEGYQYGVVEQWQPEPEINSNYQVMPVPVWCRPSGAYIFLSPGAFLKRLQPQIIHVAEGEFGLVMRQMMLYRRFWNPKAKLLFMSYNNNGIPLEQFFTRLIWRWVCHDSDIAVAGNAKVRSIWESAGYPKPIVEQTEIGVDETFFCPDAADRKSQRQRLALEGTTVIGFAGRIRDYKGVLELTDAVLRLSGDWSLLMVGSGDQQEKIRAKFEAAGQSNRLRMVGLVPRSEMPHYLRAMDIFVLPSRKSWNEQFGLVLPEAMMCGLPVVGSTSGAIPEVIGNAGLVFPSDDAGALHAVLQSLLSVENKRIELAEHGRQRALRHYSCSVLADDIYSVYRSLLMNFHSTAHVR
jgi:glycosyltransferase involved in cell wall biosynthesis